MRKFLPSNPSKEYEAYVGKKISDGIKRLIIELGGHIDEDGEMGGQISESLPGACLEKNTRGE